MPYLLPIMSLLLFLPAAPPVEPTGAEPASLEVGAVAGFQVVVDPATGRMVNNPTDLQLDRLAEGIAIERRRSSWELREFWLANGGRGVYLDGWADHSLNVEIGPEGQVRFACSQGDRHGQAAGSGPVDDEGNER